MNHQTACGVLAVLAACLTASQLHASPLAPVELRVADTPMWEGAPHGPSGVSTHPHFRVRHLTAGTPAPAVKLRVQVATDAEFATAVWDSGFVSIASTADRELTPAVVYAGPSLDFGGTYYWRAAVKDSADVASPFSLPEPFTLAAASSGADLRVTTGVGPEQLQGNPVCVKSWPPSLSAEFVGGESEVAYASIQVSLTSDFKRLIWDSGFVSVGLLGPGQRTAPITYAGDETRPGAPYFWRIRFSPDAESSTELPWSTATASFVFAPPTPDAASPGGFSRAAAGFGTGEHPVSHIAVGDVTGSGARDAVTVSSGQEWGHTLYPDVGTATPGLPIHFGSECEGRTFAAIADFTQDGQQDIAVVDKHSAGIYTYSDGLVELHTALPIDIGWGEPVAVQTADLNWDGWPDLLVAYEFAVVAVLGGEGGFEFIEDYAAFQFFEPITDILTTDFNPEDGLRETWVLSGNMLYLFREFGWLQQEWNIEGMTKLALANGSDSSSPELILAGPTNLLSCSLVVESDVIELTVVRDVEHQQIAPVVDISGRELTGDGEYDVVLVTAEAVTVWRGAGVGYELHEYAGQPGGLGATNVVIADMNGDTYPDLVVGRIRPSHAIYLNKSPIPMSISGSHATQGEFGGAFVRFQVTLDAAPVSTVVVWCETYEVAPPGGGDDQDRLPDPADFLTAQTAPMPYVPTTKRVVFAPGQTTAWFYVPLTKTFVSSQWTLHARLYSPVGAYLTQSTATSTIYATPVGGAIGAPPSGPGMNRDWRINGEVRAIASVGSNTYIGGTFDGIVWEAQGVAALTTDGTRQVALPNVSGVETVAIDPATGDMYFGGNFSIHVAPTLTIKNIAKCAPDGSLVTSFAPNPNGRVNSIALDAYGRVYFGGKFTVLEAASSLVFANIAWVGTDGSVSTHYHGGSNFYGVKNASTAHAEVLVLKVAESGYNGRYLLVGGRYFNQATAGAGSLYSVQNFTAFKIGGGQVLTSPKIAGEVRALEVNSGGAPVSMGGVTSHAILIGGAFYTAAWTNQSPAVSAGAALVATNFGGYYNHTLATQYNGPPVRAMAIDANSRLWLSRDVNGSNDPLAIYSINGGLISQTQSIAADNLVLGLAYGDGKMMATGYFTSIANQQSRYVATFSAGATAGTFLPLTSQPTGGIAKRAAYNPTGSKGFVISGLFTGLRADRGNLAAIDAQGHLLPWAPRTNGPINALVVDAGQVYFGGAFSMVSGQARTAVAAAAANDDAQGPTSWFVNVAGGTATVNALAIRPAAPGNFLVIGGDFNTVNSMARVDVAEVNPAVAGASPTPWNPDLMDGSGDAVHALLLDGDRIYIGGRFEGTTTTHRPGLIAVVPSGLAGEGQLVAWDAQLTVPCTVVGIAATNDEVVFVGDFTSAGGELRAGAACLSKSGAVLTGFQPVPLGSFKCVQATTGGLIYLGGDFISVTPDQTAGAVAHARRGVAALDTGGNILPWEANAVAPGTSDAVRVLYLDGDKLWVGGKFTGTPHPGENDLTWFNASWYITTPELPAVGSGQTYPGVSMQLSELPPSGVMWSVSGPAAAWLAIDPSTGALSGTAPSVNHQNPPLDQPVTISVTDGVKNTSRHYTVRIHPAPPPIVVSFPDAVNNPVAIQEGNAIAKVVEWDVELEVPPGQSLSAPVHILVEHLDGTARWGYEYAGQVNRIIFYPQGQMPAELSAGTIATDSLTIKLPVTIYGDKVHDPISPRVFTIKLTSLTQIVEAHPVRREVVVEIHDDDPVNPVPEHAYVLHAGVREDTTTSANPQGVVNDEPYIAWVFGSDVAGEVQGAWQVQVATNASFSNLVFAGQKSTGADDIVQVGPLAAGNYFARVKVWDAGTDSESDWFALAFTRNSPPLQAHHLAVAPEDVYVDPNGLTTVNTSMPMLTWSIQDDPDGDRQHVILTIESGGGGPNHVLDSRATPYLFEYQEGSTWQPMSQAGMLPGVSHMRLRVPSSMALTDGDWEWRVNVADPYETTVGTAVDNITVSAKYIIEGVYTNSSGPGPRLIHLVVLPNHAPIAPPVLTDPINGTFQFVIHPGALAPGEVIAVCVDPTFDPNGLGPVNEFAAAILRFPGSHLRDSAGLYERLKLVQGVCVLDARGQAGFNLGHLNPPAQPVAGFPFILPAQLELLPEFAHLKLAAQLCVRGTYAAPGEPTGLNLNDPQQVLEILDVGELSIEEGGLTNLQMLNNGGTTTIYPTGLLILHENSESTGTLLLQPGGTLGLDQASMAVTGGDAVLQAGAVSGTGTATALVHEGGTLAVNGTSMNGVVLEIAATAHTLTVINAVFTPGQNDRYINWKRTAGFAATMQGITFHAGGSAMYNVYAYAGVDNLALHGCGGDLAGEAYDFDPGEPGNDVVTWEVAAVTGLTAHSGDERILLIWQAGAQLGASFEYAVYEAVDETGPFTLVDTTSSNFYIQGQVTNNVTYHYYVRVIAWGQGSDSDIVSATPLAAVSIGISPLAVDPDHLTPAAVLGAGTHFDTTTTVTTSSNGVQIPIASILVLSPRLVLFDVETSSAPVATMSIEVLTPDVWSELGVPGYQEQLNLEIDVRPPASPKRPTIEFTDDGGAVLDDDFTDGPFLVTIEYFDNDGAPVVPATLQCIVDRDILIGGVLVDAGVDLAGTGHALWDQSSSNGASWTIDQVYMTTDPQEEFISGGELTIMVRVANEYGLYSEWYSLRIFVDSSGTFASTHLTQGKANQIVYIFGGNLTGAHDVAFDDQEIAVLEVTPIIGSYFSASSNDTYLQVKVSLSTHARVGPGTFEVFDNSAPIATGSYRTVLDITQTAAIPSYPDPLATRAAMNVTLQNGSFSWTATDIGADGRAFPIVWDRSYRSDKWNHPSPLGYGWTGTYLQHIDLDRDGEDKVGSFTWKSPDGGLHRFQAINLYPIASPHWGSGYLTPAGLAVQVSVTNCVHLVTNNPSGNVVTEIRIQTNTGVSYIFNRKTSWPLSSSVSRWYLTRVEDSNLNQHTLHYSGQFLVRIEGDILSSASGSAPSASATVHGESLLLGYHSNGLLKRVTRAWQMKEVKTVGSANVWSQAVSVSHCESVEYWYDGSRRLVLQKMPGGTRHGDLYNGYGYEQVAGGPWLLTKVYSPSRVTSPQEAVATSTNSTGSSFDSGVTPTVGVQYQLYAEWSGPSYRVVRQDQLVAAAGQTVRTLYISYALHAYPHVGASGATITQPDGSTVSHTLTQFGQSTDVTLSDGVNSYTTQYEYHQTTRAAVMVRRPRGDTTFFLYAHDNYARVTGGFTSVTPAGAYTNVTCTNLASTSGGTVDMGDYSGQLVRLSRSGQVFHRYAIIEGASSGSNLVVFGNLGHEGWESGTIEIFDPNQSPIGRFKVIQKRESPGPNPTANDFVTTYTHHDSTRLGYYFAETPAIIDPRGNVTKNQYIADQKFRPEVVRADSYVQSTSTYTVAEVGGAKKTVSVTSVVGSDKFGRTVYEESAETRTDYAYFDIDAGIGKAGRLKATKVTGRRLGHEWPASIVAEMDYDVRGNLASMLPPRALEPSVYSAAAFKTEFFYNDARQLYRVRLPASGPHGFAVKPDTWLYYDPDGRVVREIAHYASSHGSTLVTAPGGNPETLLDGSLDGVFLRPADRRSSGWLHTRYVFNEAGEVTSATSDFDVGLESAAHMEYDAMGRLKRETDAMGRQTEFDYEVRGLTWRVTHAPNTDVAASTTMVYDLNGNLVIQQFPDDTLVTYEYDGHNRCVKTTSVVAGGKLEHRTTYPHPHQPHTIQETWTPTGNASGGERRAWSQLDEFGRVFRSYFTARNASGQALQLSLSENGHPWAVTTSSLNANGVAEATWIEAATGYSTSSSATGLARIVLSSATVSSFGMRVREKSDGWELVCYQDAGGNIRQTKHAVSDGSGTATALAESILDPANNVWKYIDAIHQTTEYKRNNFGWVETMVDPSGRRTETEYNFIGLPTKVVVGSGQSAVVTETQYDLSGLTTYETAYLSGQSQVTSYWYDDRGRLKALTRPVSGITTYVYDAMDRLVEEVRAAESVRITNTYDTAGNLVRTDVIPIATSATPIGASESGVFTYDAYGNIKTATTYRYGAIASELTMEYNSFDLIEKQKVVVYNSQGHVVQVDVPGHPYSTTELGFKSVYDMSPRSFQVFTMQAEYDALGRERELTYWDDRKVTTKYEAGNTDKLSPTSIHDSGLDEIAGSGSKAIVTYTRSRGVLSRRNFGWREHPNVIRIPAVRPAEPGKAVGGAKWADTATSFLEDPRGMLKEVAHGNFKTRTPGPMQTFAGVQVRYDYSGNPVLERRIHQGGLSRVMHYDGANRLDVSLRGHSIAINHVAIPGIDLPQHHSEYLDPVSAYLPHQWRRAFTQDQVDNITRYDDVRREGASDAPVHYVDQQPLTNGSSVDGRNLIGSRSDAGDFGYDQAGRMLSDPTTSLSYEYNYRGQLTAVRSGSSIVREMTYDAFGRMVHQVDTPGTDQERGTVFIPNPGFGGAGQGADCAGEVSYTPSSSGLTALEVLQHTYGEGAVAGGIGRKRLIELVAFARDHAPYFRFLHEDTMGNTVATTSLWGDRLDLYDYTDYGTPIHTPVALDGRWIAGIARHPQHTGTHANISVITLTHDLLQPNELLGCEVRVAKADAQTAADVWRVGTVISHIGTTIHIHDPNYGVADTWTSPSAGHYTHPVAFIADRREGVRRGIIDSVVDSQTYTGNGWTNEACFHVVVDNGAFESWMKWWPFMSGHLGEVLHVRLADPGASWQYFVVLGPLEFDPQSGYKKLAIRGSKPTWLDQGDWYGIDGQRDLIHATRTGRWAVDAVYSGGETTFRMEQYAALTDEMVGWVLQPDINAAVYVPITGVYPSAKTITVSGNYAGGGGFGNLGAEGNRFAIHAPPGTETRGHASGMLSHWVAAESSKCLFGGYRYESPLAGRQNWTTTTPAPVGRQGGKNFAGLHYTLHRHYDPHLMRFTSPDPLAAPFYNLFHYTGNSPARYYDPDGLFKVDLFEIGGRQFSIDTDGYSKRAKETAVGVAVGGWDAVTFGKHLTDDDRHGLALAYGVDPNSAYYAAGQVVGNITVSAAFGVASGGLANMTHVGRVAMIGKTLGKAIKAAMIVGDAVEVAGAAQEYAETGDWSLRQTMALVGAGAAGGGYTLGKAFKVMCFVEGTEVLAATTTGAEAIGRNIEDIEVGDLVWARCEYTGEEGFKPVVHLFRNTINTLVHLTHTTSAGATPATLTGTPGHPFWSVDQGDWVGMQELRPGETLLLAHGSTATVTGTRTEHLTTPVKIYNFEVADWHTYYVGTPTSGWVWVHNRNCQYNAGSKRFHDTNTGRFVKTPVKNKVLRPDAQATLYAKYDKGGNFLKWGVTHHVNPNLRYTKADLAGGKARRVNRGPREKMLAQERSLAETNPGPENNEPWAGWRKPGHPNYRGRQ